MTTRQTRRLLAAIAVVAVLAGVYAVLLRSPQTEESDNEGAVTITEIDSDRVTRIAVQPEDGAAFAVAVATDDSGTTCTMADGTADAHYDENRMAQLRDTACAVTGTLVDPSSTDLEKYELGEDDAVHAVTITADGAETTLLFGRTSEALGGTYCRSADNSDVYFVGHDAADILLAPQEDYLLLQVLTSYYSLSTDLQSMTLKMQDGTQFAIQRRDTDGMSADEAAAVSKYVITAPQRWDADDAALSSGILSRLQEGLTAESVVQTEVSAQQLRKYGLDAPKARIALRFSNAEDTVLVGSTDGETTYVMTQGGSTVFACRADCFADLDSEDWTAYRSADLLALAKSRLKSVRLTADGTSHTARLTYIAADENRESDSDIMTGTCDGAEMTAEDIDRLYAALTNLNFTSVRAEAAEAKEKLRLRIRLTDGTERTIRFAKGGSREYLADVDGGGFVYTVSKSDVDAILAVFE